VKAVTVVMIALAGCGHGTSDVDCERMFAAEQRCAVGSAELAKRVFMQVCEAMKERSSTWLADDAKCANEASCDAMIVCKNASFAKHSEVPKVEAAMAAGKWGDAWMLCTFNADYLTSPAFVAACAAPFDKAPPVMTDAQRSEALYRCGGSAMLTAVPALAASCDAVKRRSAAP
jgi:hypothetical protein